MSKRAVSQEEYKALIDDASYLQDEAEALQYVIEEVPYRDVPTESLSIYQRLKKVDHAQTSFYRPIVEDVLSSKHSLQLGRYNSIDETFEPEEAEEKIDVQKTLRKIIKHRAALINLFQQIPLIDWEQELTDEKGRERTLFEFVQSMITFERNELKQIADLVLIYQKEKRTQREIDAKSNARQDLNGE
ncbi:MAG: hypothetical protein ACNA78_00215 [Balneolaceae bacterium]